MHKSNVYNGNPAEGVAYISLTFAKANAHRTSNYNIYSGCLVVNCTDKGRMYLYDLVNINKEASNPLKD